MIPLLIVDDESIIRETIAAMLRRKYPDQFHIFLASNGQEALSLVASENVELVLADIKMPVMNGLELLHRLHEQQFQCDVIFISGFDDYSFGGAALVGDPTDPDVLKQGGIENCDAVAAVSEDDSVNLMAAQIAKNIFRREKVICRVSDPHLQILYHKYYGLETICPTILTEQAVFRALSN